MKHLNWIWFPFVYYYVVGSSKKSIAGLLTSSNAIIKRFLCPPDKCSTLVSRLVPKPIRDNIPDDFKSKENVGC